MDTVNTMTYKGYIARIEYSAVDECLVGRLIGIQHIVGFHGDTVVEVRAAFEEAVDDYIETCEKAGLEPQKPYSGRVMLRLAPELHARVATQAQAAGESINHWAARALEKAVTQADARHA